jgi:hypothetical protein
MIFPQETDAAGALQAGVLRSARVITTWAAILQHQLFRFTLDTPTHSQIKQRVLSLINAGKVQAVIIAKLDRLTASRTYALA